MCSVFNTVSINIVYVIQYLPLLLLLLDEERFLSLLCESLEDVCSDSLDLFCELAGVCLDEEPNEPDELDLAMRDFVELDELPPLELLEELIVMVVEPLLPCNEDVLF